MRDSWQSGSGERRVPGGAVVKAERPCYVPAPVLPQPAGGGAARHGAHPGRDIYSVARFRGGGCWVQQREQPRPRQPAARALVAASKMTSQESKGRSAAPPPPPLSPPPPPPPPPPSSSAAASPPPPPPRRGRGAAHELRAGTLTVLGRSCSSSASSARAAAVKDLKRTSSSSPRQRWRRLPAAAPRHAPARAAHFRGLRARRRNCDALSDFACRPGAAAAAGTVPGGAPAARGCSTGCRTCRRRPPSSASAPRRAGGRAAATRPRGARGAR